ncbi:MAG: hypothetical protein II881_08900 [Oscillospiraceae bacterium]|nr:hypothetical protein [Oscillospiraceae bacterium]
MEKKILDFLRRYFIVAVALTLVISTGFTVYAEYTKSTRAKRVVAAYSSPGRRFSSNWMLSNESTYPFKSIYLSVEEKEKLDGGEPITINNANNAVTVSNYPQGNPTWFYNRDITYDLTGQLITFDSSGNEAAYTGSATVIVGDVAVSGSPTTITSDKTLTGGVKSDDVYHLVLPGAMFTEHFFLKLEATPKNSASDLPTKLGVYIDVTEKPVILHSGWTATLTDDASTQEKLDNLYGFNYLVSGSGNGTVKLTWDSTKITISKIFLSNKGLSETTVDNMSSIVISVTTGNSYSIQFYRNTEYTTPLTANDIAIQCVFTESEPSGGE